ncbi:MAG TPA: hypothetical protein VHK67_02330 [Rhabdochlamydiaceae bacterium]|jgi:hypothetical protein|nr:hypothetical protein [Rhabdochlamydiaceae bacterium]
MSSDLMIKCFRGAHALCHTYILSLHTPTTVTGYATTFFNFIANVVPSPLPKMTYWATTVVSSTPYMNCYNLPHKGSTFKLFAGNAARVALFFFFPRFALGMGAVALGSRLITYALSPRVRDVIFKVIQNDLIISGPFWALQLQLAVACIYLMTAINEHDRELFDEQTALFKKLITTDNIGQKDGVKLMTQDGQTVESLGQQIVQELDDYKQLDAQQQGDFDPKNLMKLFNLLRE